MKESNFDGTLVLEKLAEIGKLDEFYVAVDSDDFEAAKILMKKAKIDRESIAIVLSKMENAEE